MWAQGHFIQEDVKFGAYPAVVVDLVGKITAGENGNSSTDGWSGAVPSRT